MANVAGKGSIPVPDERLSTGSAKDDQSVQVEKKKHAPVALDIKYEVKKNNQKGLCISFYYLCFGISCQRSSFLPHI